MKSSTKDKVEGKIHQVKGKVKETIGKAINDNTLQAEGIVENVGGKAQENVGKLKKAVGK
jgi:uncharacterized protein YjbJ (UPF0337 family)